MTGEREPRTDAPYVADREAFDAFTHPEIWELAHEPLDPGALGRVAEQWRVAAETLEQLTRTFAATVRVEFEQWDGRGAAGAREAAEALIGAGTSAQRVCAEVFRLMESNAAAAQSVRDALPPPSPPYVPDPDPVREVVDGGLRRMSHDIAAATALADAQDVLTFLYNSTLVASGDSVPAFEARTGDTTP